LKSKQERSSNINAESVFSEYVGNKSNFRIR